MRNIVRVVLFVLVVGLAGSTSGANAAYEPKQYDLQSASITLSSPQAGAHADVTTNFTLTTDESGQPFGLTRDVVVALPPGIVGDPEAFPKCTTLQLGNAPSQSKCPMDSQVGSVDITLTGLLNTTLYNQPVYDMPAPGGSILARFGFFAGGYPMFLNVRINPDTNSLIAAVEDAPTGAELVSSSLTFWGVPSNPIHDPQRLTPEEAYSNKGPVGGRKSSLPEVPFMTNPASCEERQATVSVDSYQEPGSMRSMTIPFPQITGCALVPFDPASTVVPTSSNGTTGSGLDYELIFPTSGFQFGNLLADSEIKRDEVVLPEGMTINPSDGVELAACTEAELAKETYNSPPNSGCPEASKIGSVTADTPLIDRTPVGALYLAKPYENPFGSLLALYMTLKIPDRGVLVKMAGRISLNPETGQITTIFDKLPQLPVATFHLHFREGARAPLVTPFACGTYEAVSNMTPWSAPSSVLRKVNAFKVESGPNHTACPSGSTPPFDPEAIAGTQNNTAGSYSPFYLRITRQDGEQEITKFSTTMPPGLTGNLTGIPFCSDSAIETARHRTGREELVSPSCPVASEIGHTLVGAGVGDVLAQTPGKVYLAGPYHGAPLSLVSITSATVGPFDLGTVVIRFGLRINPVTAQVEVDSTGSDPIPHILDGIVVHVRDIRVYIDRHDFMINPTNCQPLSIANTITGSGGNIATTTDDVPVTTQTRMQAAECSSLRFKPAFNASTSGKTSRKNGASLHVKLTYPKLGLGTQANIRSVRVELPKQLPSRLSTLQQACTDTVFDQNPATCPASSRVGTAKAITPILPEPLAGPAYFVSHGGSKWPELIIVLQGYGFTIDLHGETFINKGITSSTFRTVPDQPVSSFQLTLPQGPDSALASPDNLCHITRTITVRHKTHNGKIRKTRKTVAGSLTMPTAFTAQNGTVIHQNTKIAVAGCARHRSRKTRHGVAR